jgi:beta-glucosidase
LKARFELGEFDPDSLVSWSALKYDVVNSKAHQELALEAARKSIVLLLNKNSILPLSKNGLKIAVMGPNATDSIMQRGNYEGKPAKTFTVLEGIQAKIPNVIYEKGCDKLGSKVLESVFNRISTPDRKEIGFAAKYWNTADLTGEIVATQIVSSPFVFDVSGGTVFTPGVNLSNFSARYEGILNVDKAGEIILSISGDDGYRVYINNDTVIDNWGRNTEQAREYVLSAKVGEEYKIVIEYMQLVWAGSLKFDLGYEVPYNPIQAAEKVRDADIVIFVGGISPKLEGEEMNVDLPGFKGGDRTSIELPAVQRELIQALKKIGKKVIFVNCSGSAIGLAPEIEVCDAIIQAWYPGQAGGTAVADVLFGDYNPAGRLPVTFYKNTEQLPHFEDYSMKGRTYRYMTESPLFVFGHGLSYTSFNYGDVSLASAIKAGESTTLAFTLENTGKMDGDEVVQVYIRNLQDAVGPLKTLRAFERIHLKAGESKKISIDLPATTFEWFNAETNKMEVKPGKFEVLFGGTSLDKELKKLQINLE